MCGGLCGATVKARGLEVCGQADSDAADEKIAKSSDVKIKVNKLVFGLQPLHLKAFQDLLRTLE